MAKCELSVSIIVPIYNESKSIHNLATKLILTGDKLLGPYEIIFINDGSSDNSLTILQSLAQKNSKRIKLINFTKNYGQTASLKAGIDYATGDVIVPIDGDLQNDPEDIPLLVQELAKGYDVVSGWRKARKDAFLSRTLISRIANFIISKLSGVKLHDYGCTLKAYRRKFLADIHLYGEMHRFIPIYAHWMGARITEIPVNHHNREHGKSNYGLERIFKVVLDILVIKFLEKFLTKPIYIFGGYGLACLGIGSLCEIISIILKMSYGISFIRTPLPLLGLFCLMIGFSSILTGLLAEIIVRTYYETQNKKTYTIAEDSMNLNNTKLNQITDAQELAPTQAHAEQLFEDHYI